MKKAALLLTIGLAIGVQAAFFVPVANASFAPGQGTIVQQPNKITTTSLRTLSAGNPLQYIYSLGNGLIGSTTAVSLSGTFWNGRGSSIAQFFRVDIDDNGSNVCTYDADLTATGTSTGTVVLTHVFQQIGYGCVLHADITYRLTITISDGTWSSRAQLDGVLQSVPPFVFVSSIPSSVSSEVNPPYFLLNAYFASLDPTRFSSGISTSTIQNWCNNSYSTSTGLFSDISNGVSYGLCTVTAFLFVPDQAVLQSFGELSSTTRTKIPFSYYYDFSTVISGQSASTTANFSPLSVDLRATGVGSTTPWATVLPTSFTYLASSTIGTYIPQSLYDLLFFLMRSAIWVVVVFHIYHRLRPKNATHV